MSSWANKSANSVKTENQAQNLFVLRSLMFLIGQSHSLFWCVKNNPTASPFNIFFQNSCKGDWFKIGSSVFKNAIFHSENGIEKWAWFSISSIITCMQSH